MRQLKTFMRNRKEDMLGCGECTCYTLQCWRNSDVNCGCGDNNSTKKGRENALITYNGGGDDTAKTYAEAYYDGVKYYINAKYPSDFLVQPRTENPLVVEYEEGGTPEKAAEMKEKLTFWYDGEGGLYTEPVGEQLGRIYNTLKQSNRESLIPLWINQAMTDALNGDRQYHLTHYYQNGANLTRVDGYTYFTDDYDGARYCREPYSEREWGLARGYEDENYSVMSEDSRELFINEQTFVPDEIYQRMINLPYENTPVEAIYPSSSGVDVAIGQEKNLGYFDTDPRRTVGKVNVSIDHPEIATFELQDAGNIWVTGVSMGTATITLSYGNISETITVNVTDR